NMYLSNIGIWDGANWDTLGAGVSGPILSSVEYNGNLFIGGGFIYAGGASFPDPRADNLTYWDGNQYHLTDYHNFGALVNSLATYNNELYLGASQPFDIDSVTYSAIARYNGTSWSDVGGGVFSNFREILCMTKFNGELIVAGRFDFAGTTPANNIARWDGNQWHTIGDGLNYYVRSVYVDSSTNTLYAGGSFTGSGTTPLNFIAQWDGTAWLPLGNGLSDAVRTITKYKSQLYAGTTPFSNPSALMSFDGTNWAPVIPSPNKLVYCINVFQDELYVSGIFDSIGGVPYAGIARYRDTITSVQPNIISEKLFEIFPNPATDKLDITLLKNMNGTFQVIVTDAAGKNILKREYEGSVSTISIKLPEELSNGVYTCQVVMGKTKHSQNFIIQ
ncbi:MAG TPA: T9SS type A sorting domain-containing protein, partial [Bacteroidia bacterium]|nr:T9SS type A sorting domain-containing protein [Bacteroidia bacterium]